jgi:ATP-dependent exoDNAse (exonuclease V) alpha subunit
MKQWERSKPTPHDTKREHNQLVKTFETKTAQVENLRKTGNVDGKKMLLIMDESSMAGAKDMARVSRISTEIGQRVVFQGDIKQYGSVAAGKAFTQMQEGGINLSKIEKTKRFDNATAPTKRAIEEMKLGNYSGALEGLDRTLANGLDDLYVKVVGRYMDNRSELKQQGHVEPKVGIVAITNKDRKAINVAVREALKSGGEISRIEFQKEHLNDPTLTAAQQKYVPALTEKMVDRVTALRNYRSLGIVKDETLKIVGHNMASNTLTLENARGKKITIDPSKSVNFSFATSETRFYSQGDKIEARANIGRGRDPGRITNGTRGVISSVNADGAHVTWDDGKKTMLNNQQLRHVDHAYARTSYKEQSVTNQREIVAVSEIGANAFNREAAYVGPLGAKLQFDDI